MPRRKKAATGTGGDDGRAGYPAGNMRGWITATICMKRELDGLYRGKPVFVCACPLCAPNAWCKAIGEGGRLCDRPRAYGAEESKYPFCYRHYKLLVDTYPRPTARALAQLRHAARADVRVTAGEGGKVIIAATAEIMAAYMARVRPAVPDSDVEAARAVVGKLVAGAAGGGR